MAADDIWYYTRNGERIGPVTELELSNIVARGDLRPHDLVWKAGMPQWVQLRFAEGLPEAPPPEPASDRCRRSRRCTKRPLKCMDHTPPRRSRRSTCHTRRP